MDSINTKDTTSAVYSCYVCGKDNPIGLKIDFAIDEASRRISAKFVPKPEHQGYEGIVHGGILSALLDEAMGKLAFTLLGVPVVTAELTIKFKTPSTPGDELDVTAWITDEANRLILAEAKVERGLVLIAEAKGKLIKASPDFNVQRSQ